MLWVVTMTQLAEVTTTRRADAASSSDRRKPGWVQQLESVFFLGIDLGRCVPAQVTGFKNFMLPMGIGQRCQFMVARFVKFMLTAGTKDYTPVVSI